LLDMTSVSRLFPITDRLGLLATGIAGDLSSACFSCHLCQNALRNVPKYMKSWISVLSLFSTSSSTFSSLIMSFIF
jgi:hypothetical protein